MSAFWSFIGFFELAMPFRLVMLSLTVLDCEANAFAMQGLMLCRSRECKSYALLEGLQLH